MRSVFECLFLLKSKQQNMQISQELIKETEAEVDVFIDNHQSLPEQTRKSLRKAPELFRMLNELYLNTGLNLDADQKVSAAIRYISSNYDFLPADFTGPLGSLDDIMVSALVLRSLSGDVEIADFCEVSKNLQETSDDIINLCEKYLPEQVSRKIKRDFS